jgi:C4-dicarboxylate-binding protein DctP
METGTMAGFFSMYQVIYIPYLFKSEEVAWRFFDTAPSFKTIKDKMSRKANFRILGIGQNGFRCFHNSKRPLRKPEDFKGLKFRVMESPVFVKTVEAFGAKAVPIAWPEVYTSLQTGVIDGAEVPPAIVERAKLYEVQGYLTLDGHTFTEDNFVISESFFQSLPAHARQTLQAAARIAQTADRASDVVLTNVTSMDVLKKHMKIYSPTNEEKNMYKERCQAPVIKWLKGRVGSAIVDQVLADVDRIEKEMGY